MRHYRNQRRGIALAIAVVLTAILITLSFTILDLTNKNFNASKEAVFASDAHQLSDAGSMIALDMLKQYILDQTLQEPDYFNSGADTDGDGESDIPRNIIRVDVSENEYYLVEILDDGIPDNAGQDGEMKIIRSTGYKDGYTKTVEMTVQTGDIELPLVFSSAIYSGNSSNDASFVMNLGGTGTQADSITGTVYSNSDIRVKISSTQNDAMDEFDRTFTTDPVTGYVTEDVTVAGRTVNVKADEDRSIKATGDVENKDTGAQLTGTRIENNVEAADVPITRESIDELMAAYPQYVVNVKNEFAANEVAAKNAPTSASYFGDSTTRTAYWNYYRDYVIPNSSNPAHIFTHGAQNSTGTAGYTGTADTTIASGAWVSSTTPPAKLTSAYKGYNTYHIKDPFDVDKSGSSDGKVPSYGGAISLSKTGTGQDGTQTTEGNMKIYYIEGDLWIHDPNAYEFNFKHGTTDDGMKIAFVVKGNIYFSDNVFWKYNGSAQTDPERANPLTQNDFFMFMAIKKTGDDAGASSGNIVLGDPQFGTVEELDAMLYAENNFKENNITASGSSQFVINGNMTAGNKVDINRDSGSTHSKMMVNYESRLVHEDYADNFKNSMAPWMQELFAGDSDFSIARPFKIVSWRQYPAGYVDPDEVNTTVWTRTNIVDDIVTHNATVQQ